MKIDTKKAFSRKRMLALVVIVIAVVAMFFSNPDIKDFFSENNSVKLKFQTGIEYDMLTYGKDVLFVNNEGIYAVDKSGREAWSLVVQTASPCLQTMGDYIMLTDLNGKSVRTFRKEKAVTHISTENKIICAKINKQGNIAVATDELGYKGMVAVYDKNGDETFRWHSGTGYIGDIDISSKKQLAVAQVMTDKEQVYTKIIVFKPGAKDDAETIAEVDGIVMKLKYQKNGKLVAVSDKGVWGFKKSGKTDFSFNFNGRIPVKCNIENENNMVFTFDSGVNSTIIESYSSMGKLRGAYDVKSKMNAMDVNGECIVVAARDGIVYVTPKGEVKKEIKTNKDVKEIIIFSNRSKLLTVGDRSVELIKFK